MPSVEEEVTFEYGGYKFKNRMRILPLTLVPENGTSVLDWRPFPGGDPLDKIIEKANEKCIRAYKGLRWTSRQIEAFVEFFDVVPYGIASVKQLDSPDFKDIGILLVDLDAVGGRQEELGEVRVFVSEQHKARWRYLTQVRNDSDTNSLAEYFVQLPIFTIPSDLPQIMENQAAFESFLGNLCERYFRVISCLPPPPPPSDARGTPEDHRATATYVDSLPQIAAKARDAAITRDLSTEETLQLASGAAVQEFALAQIAERARPQADYDVIVDAIRQPVMSPTEGPRLERPTFDTVDLVEVNPARPLSDLTEEQRDAIADLGIREETSAAVHIDTPDLRGLIGDLGDAVETTRFSGELPRW